ncbi:MAG: SMC-Scp complex subunit ScpB [Planctomycetota bacterium]
MAPLENKSPDEVKRIVEAILFAVQEPISVRKISEIIEGTEAKEIREVIQQLRDEYDSHDRVFQIEEIANGFQLLSRPEYHEWISKIRKKSGESKLSQPALETLSIIAYKQPIIRAEIEAIRGVQSGQMIRTLIEKGLVKITGRDEVLGRPLLYGTTTKFLDHFGLKSIKDLPKVEDLEMP